MPRDSHRRVSTKRSHVGLAVVVAVVAIAVTGVACAGLRHSSDNRDARAAIGSFVAALRKHSFVGACRDLAGTAPPRRAGLAGCPARLRKTNVGVGWDYMLRTIETRVEARHNGRVEVVAWEPEGLIGGGPRYRFTLVRERHVLRIEHFFGFF
jgi:hypothetical protein